MRTWVVALLIFSAIFALFFVASNDLADEYDESGIIDDEYREKYDRFSDSADEYRDIAEDISDSTGLELVASATTGIFRSLFNTVKIVFDGLSILQDLTTDAMTDWGVPEEVADVVFPLGIAVVTIIMIFLIISAINRGNKI